MRQLIGSKRAWAPAMVLAAALPVLAVQAQSASPSAPTAILPDGPGKAETIADCAGCHAANIVATERHTAEEWNDLIAVMVGRGAQVSDADTIAITAYLARNYGKPAAGGGK